MSVCVCVCVRERERERVSDCVYVCVCVCVCVCCMRVFVHTPHAPDEHMCVYVEACVYAHVDFYQKKKKAWGADGVPPISWRSYR